MLQTFFVHGVNQVFVLYLLFLCRCTGYGVLAALDGILQDLFYCFLNVHAITFKDAIQLLYVLGVEKYFLMGNATLPKR